MITRPLFTKIQTWQLKSKNSNKYRAVWNMESVCRIDQIIDCPEHMRLTLRTLLISLTHLLSTLRVQKILLRIETWHHKVTLKLYIHAKISAISFVRDARTQTIRIKMLMRRCRQKQQTSPMLHTETGKIRNLRQPQTCIQKLVRTATHGIRRHQVWNACLLQPRILNRATSTGMTREAWQPRGQDRRCHVIAPRLAFGYYIYKLDLELVLPEIKL